MKVLMVGASLDTNGQKQRYVEAARRWGDDPDVLKALIAGDWYGAGIPARFAEAAKKGEGLAIRAAHKATAYFDFPYDILWTRQTGREVLELANEADVIHLTNDVRTYFELGQAKQRKPALIHHHGTLFRSQHPHLRAEARRLGFLQAVSTIDLLRYGPEGELHWLPAPIDMDMMAAIRDENRRPDDGVVRVVSCPTRRDLKSTNQLIAAVDTLKAEGLPVELVLVEGRTWAEALAVKATADIYFDQVAVPALAYPGGYGCNAIEAWGMGIPVIAGADEWTMARMDREFEATPFVFATQATIEGTLRALVESERERRKWGAIGLAHAAKYHAEKPALHRLAHLYGLAISMKAHASSDIPEEFPLTPGTFVTVKSRALVTVKNQQIRMRAEEPLRIDNPQLAQRMREVARRQPELMISEVYDAG